MTLEVQILEAAGEINQDAWLSLCRRARHTIFQLPAWQISWWKTFGGDRPLRLHQFYSRGRLVALLPLFLDRGVLHLVGEGHSDYLDVIVEAEFEEQLVAWLHANLRGRDLDLHGLTPDGTLDRWARRCCRSGLRMVEKDAIPALAIDLARSPDLEAQALGRAERRRRDKALQLRGAVSVQHLTDPAAMRLSLPILFGQHEKRWSGSPQEAVFRLGRMRRFYQELVERLGPLGAVQLSMLLVDEKPVATALAFRLGDTLFWYKPTYDPDWARWSPGERLLIEMIREARRGGYRRADLGRGDSHFKRRFSGDLQFTFVRSYRGYASQALGAWFSARGLVRTLYRRIVPDPG